MHMCKGSREEGLTELELREEEDVGRRSCKTHKKWPIHLKDQDETSMHLPTYTYSLFSKEQSLYSVIYIH